MCLNLHLQPVQEKWVDVVVGLFCSVVSRQSASAVVTHRMGGKKYSIGHKEFQIKPMIKCLFAEMLGTFMLVLVGCGAALNWITPLDITQVVIKYEKQDINEIINTNLRFLWLLG